MFPRYLIADYERRNFSVSQCSWDPGAQENIVAIESPAKSEASGKPIAGTSTTALTSGRIAGIVVGSTVGLLLVLFLAFVGKRKLTGKLNAEIHGMTELAANNAPCLPEAETPNAKMQELDGGSNVKSEIDGRRYLGAELEARGEIEEKRSDEEVGHGWMISDRRVSELPS